MTGGFPAAVPGDAAGQEQWLYARWLSLGMRAGLVLAVVGWVLCGWLPASGEDPARLLHRLSQPARQLMAGSAFPWVGRGPGPVIGLAGIAWLAACALPALLSLLPMARRQHDRVLIGLALAQVVVLLAGIGSVAWR